MEELKEKVKSLKAAENDTDRIRTLQEINELLLTKYAIKIGELKVVPMWVEAYYYDKEKFCDENTHKDSKQKGRQGMLYQHTHAENETNGGVDLCLSDGDYYLSFLIKASLINGEFCKQERTYGKIRSTGLAIDEQSDVLIEDERGGEIYHTQRIGLTSGSYKDALLAAFPMNALGIPEYDFAFARKSLSGLVESYMKDYIASNPNKTKKEYKAECTKTFGWCPDVVDSLLKGVQ